MQTLMLIIGMWMMAGMVLSAESPLPMEQKPQERTLSSGTSSWEDSSTTYTVQSGYEGYLVPVQSQSIKDIIKTVGIFGALPILSKYAVSVVLKVGAALAVVVLFGILLNYGLCKCTSLCPISFHQGWDRSFSVSQDQLQSAGRLLASALDKFDRIDKNSL